MRECSPGGSVVRKSPANAGDENLIPQSGNPLDKEVAIHCSGLEIPWTEKPGAL